MVDPHRYATSAERAKRAREQIIAACWATIAFGVLLSAWMATLFISGLLQAGSLAGSVVKVILLVMGVVFVALGLGIWQRIRWCATMALILLIVLMAYHVCRAFLVGHPSGSLFLLVVPLVPAIAVWVGLSAMRDLARYGRGGEM
jgi:FtsH-binding integral membrane protein